MATIMTPTHPAITQLINHIFKVNQELIETLADRWQDESQYEDIAEYQKRLQKEMPTHFVITKMTKRPFGFHFQVKGDAVYYVKCTSREYKWGRVS